VGLKEGFVQVYTGNGKGKSTAAIGLAVRAAGAGLKSYIIQFMKDYNYSELRSLELLHEFIELEKVGKDDFVFRKELPPQEEIDLVATALNKAEIKMLSGKYDIIILDEACVSIYFKILKEEQILEFINKKPKEVELVITGRYCPKSIIDKADLVTEMKEINHYYQKGVVSRKGIDF
jgi:cob(I)alamin adenosyltransferase